VLAAKMIVVHREVFRKKLDFWDEHEIVVQLETHQIRKTD
jgi:hypothetical protein